MNTSFILSDAAQTVPAFAVVTTGPRVLEVSELLLVSGGAPRGTWLQAATPDQTVAIVDTSAPRGTW